ncbi:pol [Bovine atadenovirus D]|uniref:DNA polymerase n=1 Tax=Bovine adenovirus 4 TaxID=70333 RepID=Q997I4_ADEB4|nr:pol [Bovine atadenovirus D]AAK13183.1 pol [Bovine adenovirus 4]
MASKTIVKHRTTHYITGYFEDTPIKIIYYKDFKKSFFNFLQLQGLQPKAQYKSFLKPEDILQYFSEDEYPSVIKIWKLNKKFLYYDECKTDGKTMAVELVQYKNAWFLVKDIKKQQKCENCGVTFNSIHTCNVKRRDFYYHFINHETKHWWEQIKFNPVGALESTKRLFIVYDIETYTYHSTYGKQLLPYLIVFELIGSKTLQKIAAQIAYDCGFMMERGCFFMLNHRHDVIGNAFKKFRIMIQKTVAKNIWLRFSKEQEIETLLNYDEILKLNKEKKLKLAYPQYVEIFVIGHNICGFDEIVLASHVLEGIRDQENLAMFNFSRSFMPRAGKLLFNDVTLSLPNPCYKKPDKTTFERWKKGILLPEDLPWQGLKFMVRDTFLLTHCSLRNAAAAYQLNVSKGHCPYDAINDYFMLGDYEKDKNGYPVEKYWKDKAEYEQNKPNGQYNIIEEAKKYCIDDVKVTAQLVSKLIDGYQEFCNSTLKLPCLFNIFQRPTISSNTQMLFKQLHYREENINSEYLNNLEAPSEKMYSFVRASVRGGRCYPTFLGIYTEPVYVYDICGMYASALTHPMPYGRTLNPFEANTSIDEMQNMLDSSEVLSYFDPRIKAMIVVADCEPPTLEYLDVLPPLCSKKSGKLCWTNEPLINETVTSIDLITLHNRGWKCKIMKNELYAVWPNWKTLCKQYVEINIAAKERADKEKNKTQRSISKLLSNALYGSFATKIDKKKVIFAEDIEEKDKKLLREGKSEITSYTTVISSSLPKSTDYDWNKYFLNLPEVCSTTNKNLNEKSGKTAFIEKNDHVIFKPITFLSAECNDLVLTTIEDKAEWIKNNRYPTQIASFVLAWTRAFMSEWADILYGEDRGKSYSERDLKSLYGDTDSLFLSQKGHELMCSKGAHRLKHNNGKLVFDENEPQLQWLVECETVCEECHSVAFATESCFLAPKLYGLKEIKCTKCNHIGSGKLRAKGHAKECLSYDVLKRCFNDYYLLENPKENFMTKRKSLKRTLQTGNEISKPFTVVEKQLLRILRPWKDMTLRKGIQLSEGYLLYPYDKRHPNPRPQECLTENPFWDDT